MGRPREEGQWGGRGTKEGVGPAGSKGQGRLGGPPGEEVMVVAELEKAHGAGDGTLLPEEEEKRPEGGKEMKTGRRGDRQGGRGW